jgi:GNAT superfamily N-acetyltransferase
MAPDPRSATVADDPARRRTPHEAGTRPRSTTVSTRLLTALPSTPAMRRFRRPRVTVRPLGTADHAALDAVFAGLSPASRVARYLAPIDALTPGMRRALLDVAPGRHVALLAEARDRAGAVPVGIGRYVVDGPGRAELAYEVVDAWQGRGVGRRLVSATVDHARAAGIEQLHASISRDNEASLGLLRSVLPQLRVTAHGPVLEVAAWLTEPRLDIAGVLDDLAIA